MLYIENLKTKVIVLKALGSPDIRLFPGFNEIDARDAKELNPYFKSQAAQALLNGYKKQQVTVEKKDTDSNRIDGSNLKRVSRRVKIKAALRFVTEEMDTDELKDASHAREKNDMLNKSGLTIKSQNEQILKKDTASADQAKELSDLKATVALMAEALKKAKIEL